METSHHAKTRQQQRCIDNESIDFTINNGIPIKKPGNTFEYRIQKKDKQKILKEIKRKQKIVEKAFKIGVLTSSDEKTIITVYHLI